MVVPEEVPEAGLPRHGTLRRQQERLPRPSPGRGGGGGLGSLAWLEGGYREGQGRTGAGGRGLEGRTGAGGHQLDRSRRGLAAPLMGLEGGERGGDHGGGQLGGREAGVADGSAPPLSLGLGPVLFKDLPTPGRSELLFLETRSWFATSFGLRSFLWSFRCFLCGRHPQDTLDSEPFCSKEHVVSSTLEGTAPHAKQLPD